MCFDMHIRSSKLSIRPESNVKTVLQRLKLLENAAINRVYMFQQLGNTVESDMEPHNCIQSRESNSRLLCWRQHSHLEATACTLGMHGPCSPAVVLGKPNQRAEASNVVQDPHDARWTDV